jgi:isopentenyl phosphate kinase
MLYFLKLGGSLITDKDSPHTARPDVIDRLAVEIRSALNARPDLRLVIGHGSGSFGHVPARKYNTRLGISTPADWRGFHEVWQEARALNQIVLEALQSAGLPCIAFPPSAAVIAADARVERWDIAPLQSALSAGMIPLINGDTVFDTHRGGTILSTEDLFLHLTPLLRPQRILLAGIEDGVWEDYPKCEHLAEVITPAGYVGYRQNIGGSASVDVTGGMREKVELMLHLVQDNPDLRALIFSGLYPGRLQAALSGEQPGTLIQGTNV